MTKRAFRVPGMAAFACCLWLGVASAADPDHTALRFNRVSVEQGLAQSTINAIEQDSLGFMWFGTADGLSRYDGYRFRNFQHIRGNPDSLSDGFVRAIEEDGDGFLWVGTHRGLNRYDPRRELFRVHLIDTATRALELTRQDVLWAGTDQGLYRYQPETDDFEWVPGSPTEIYALDEGEDGRLWLGTRSQGLAVYDPRSTAAPRRVAISENGAVVLSLLAEDEAVWVGTQHQGLFRLSRDGQVLAHHLHDPDKPDSLNDNRVTAMTRDSAGRLWVATFSALHRLHTDQLGFSRYRHDPTDPHSPGQGDLRSLETDFSGLLWIGTNPGGVARVDPTPQFKTWGPTTIGSDVVLCIAAGTGNAVWVGTANGLSQIRRDGSEPVQHLPRPGAPDSISHHFIRSCSVTGDGTWFGTQDGLNRFDPATGAFERFAHDPENPGTLSHPVARRLLRTRSGDLWIGTHAGLDRFDPQTRQFQRPVSGRVTDLDTLDVSALGEGVNGDLWIGSHQGLYRLGSDQQVTHHNHDPSDHTSLSHSIVNAVHMARNGVLWVGTNGGLNRLRPQTAAGATFEVFGRADGFASEAISHILEDSKGRLWISTFRGISRFDPATGEVRNFGPEDGTLPDYAVSAGLAGSDGTLYFGGLGGVTWFQPDQIQDDPAPPRVVLTDLRLGNRTVRPRNHDPDSPLAQAITHANALTLDHGTSDLAFEFSALHYAAPWSNRYVYRLDGLHPDWISTGADRRLISIANLHPGSYRLRVRGSNKDGVWQPKEATLALTILPPWWMTWWARSLAAGLILGVLFATFRLRLARLTRQRALLQHQVAERTQELEAKNDELGEAYRAMETLSMTDPLTGLSNRRFLLKHLEDDITMVNRRYQDWIDGRSPHPPEESDLTFFLVDLDHFKKVNDAYGHAAGDELLVQAKDLLLEVFRESDFCARWGGEEFLAVARFCNRSHASDLAERLRNRAEAHCFVLENGQPVRMTWSIGFASYPFMTRQPTALSWAQVVNVADRCLYSAKRSGRNAWVGLSSTPQTAFENVVQQIQEHPRKLVDSGALSVTSSIAPLSWE